MLRIFSISNNSINCLLILSSYFLTNNLTHPDAQALRSNSIALENRKKKKHCFLKLSPLNFKTKFTFP